MPRILALTVLLATVGALAQAPAQLSDAEFWRILTELSEPGGRFAPQLMSNEDSAQFVMPDLAAAVRPGAAYVGVGSEPNFTYMAATRPSIAFIIDIRRDNMLEHLMYKALFDIAPDRSTFVSRLFSRQAPPAALAGASAAALFAAYRTRAADPALLDDTTRLVADRLVRARGFALAPADLETIAGFLASFATAGPDSLKGFGDGTMLTYAELMAATDLAGRAHGFLESEDRYGRVRDLQQRNLIVPVVGDFAGDKALRGIGAYLRSRQSVVGAFYVSNVERYLFEQGRERRFYANVAELPTTPGSVFVRSVTTDISRRLSIPIPDGTARWRTFVAPMGACLDGVRSGRIQAYRDLFVN